jgi:hypothetical protein
MQTLGLVSESKRTDGWLKSLLWPRVENAWDVDYLGQQGMWVCTIIAVFTLIASVLSANPVLIFIEILAALFFLLGGMGVRGGNWPAAAMVLAYQVLDILWRVAKLQPPSVFSILFAVILFSNLRATFLASQWRPLGEGEDRPSRFSETLADKFVDQMPAKLWPKLQIPFVILGVSLLLLTLAGLGVLLVQRLGLAAHS